jgi:hypothetical protein
MSSVFRILKNLFFWSYGRSTWQYDVLCVLILAFVFLTPKAWFDQGELSRQSGHQNGFTAVSKLLIAPENSSSQSDAGMIERRVREMTNRPDARVRGVREVRSSDGRTLAYEVDIE